MAVIILDDSAQEMNIVTTQGNDFKSQPLRLGTRETETSEIEFIDMTGWTGAACVRAKIADKDKDPDGTTKEPLAVITVAIDPDQADPDTRGTFRLLVDSAQLAALPADKDLPWDLDFDRPGEGNRTYFFGTLRAKGQVTI